MFKNILRVTILTISLLFIFVSCSDNLDAKTDEDFYIKYGTSFGFCFGYCQENISISNSELIYKKISRTENNDYPFIETHKNLTEQEWSEIKNSFNIESFLALNEYYGCPDCADGGAEWMEIKYEGEVHRVTFEYSNEPEILKDYIGLFRNKLSNASKNYNFNKSHEAWENLKSNNGNSYRYTTEFNSWVGFGSKTIIEIQNGTVISREYEEFSTNESNSSLLSYMETGSDLGSHTEGAPVATVDELYDSCISNYLFVDANTNYINFQTNEIDLLKSCSYIPKNCADDCVVGIQLSNFEWIQ
jgi:hypothetical protein